MISDRLHLKGFFFVDDTQHVSFDFEFSGAWLDVLKHYGFLDTQIVQLSKENFFKEIGRHIGKMRCRNIAKRMCMSHTR